MRTNHVKKTVQAAMLAALVFAATYAVKIPSPTNGYVNLGDCFV
ncbi:MAG: ECF transporter S component, partial [Oscillospiraceae bacterium]|nr:ECF transporter S component [Oscillospiraceae bacterium]